jgi:4a-hydroxytetrahydrobiopterin dehydratase
MSASASPDRVMPTLPAAERRPIVARMNVHADRKCQACNKDTPKLTQAQVDALHRQAPEWLVQDDRLYRQYRFRDFLTAIRFVDEMARIAESEQHHPVFSVDYDKVDVANWTHAIGGLSENDFILAAKLDRAAMNE